MHTEVLRFIRSCCRRPNRNTCRCRDFHELLPKLLKPDAIYSYFNGLAADNAFFHTVYCNIARAELAQLGLEAEFVALPIDCSDPKVWQGVR